LLYVLSPVLLPAQEGADGTGGGGAGPVGSGPFGSNRSRMRCDILSCSIVLGGVRLEQIEWNGSILFSPSSLVTRLKSFYFLFYL
jgi:hypothetical protein